MSLRELRTLIRLLDDTRSKESEWREGRRALETALTSTTEQCDARVASMQVAMQEVVAVKNRLESEVARMTEESTHLKEMLANASSHARTLQDQIGDLEKKLQE